ncbi:MAG: DUF2828 family protein [Clostridia bacterium]|nr:DUF2828 family protein [Clostridia bacterium]
MLTELERESNLTLTENGAPANRSSGSRCLDFFAACGALRGADPDVPRRLFFRAWTEDADTAMRALFYARDIRGGLGERELFRGVLSWMARIRPEAVRRNIRLIPEYGRWDDLLPLLDTPCAEETVRVIRERLEADRAALAAGGQISLLAKWLPSVHTASDTQRARARLLCRRLGMTEKEYRKTLAALRSRIDVLEKRLCAADYAFDYEKLPSGAMHKYREAFLRHDRERYARFLDRVLSGEAAMHAGTLYPYEIVRACIPDRPLWGEEEQTLTPEMIRSLDAAWKSLPDWGDARNALAVIDGSGSMYSGGSPTPAEVAMSLGIWFAEHNTGLFRDCFITFSRTPQLVRLQGGNIADRVRYCMSFNEIANTDLRAVFELLLGTALTHHLPQEEMPETLYIISDMEFDEGVDCGVTLFEEIRALYEANGYRLPALVYWNVDRRHEQVPVRRDEQGTVLVSGCSPSVFRAVIGQDATPERFMASVLNGERYRPIRG